MKITIVGSGWVGTLLGKALAKSHDVTFYDISTARLKQLKEEGFASTNDINEAVADSDVSFVCVPTPTIGDKIDLSFIRSACETLGKALVKAAPYHLTVIKSTVLPGTCETVVIPILEKLSNRLIGKNLGVCSNPEFLTEISGSWTSNEAFIRTPNTEEKFIIGESDTKAGDLLEKIYKPFSKPIFRSNLKTAELVKYASNCCLAARISYWNEIFLICKHLGIEDRKSVV